MRTKSEQPIQSKNSEHENIVNQFCLNFWLDFCILYYKYYYNSKLPAAIDKAGP